MNQLSDNDLIDFVYKCAVENLKDEWIETESIKWYEHIVNLPEKERVVYTVTILDMQVNNGGFNQYFVNGYGQFAKETIKSLELINTYEISKILTRALNKVKNGLNDDIFRNNLLAGKIDSLHEDDNLDDYLDSLQHETIIMSVRMILKIY